MQFDKMKLYLHKYKWYSEKNVLAHNNNNCMFVLKYCYVFLNI